MSNHYIKQKGEIIMAIWWYFKNVSIDIAPLEKQTVAAESIVPNKDYWLGYHRHASLQNCQKVTNLIYSLNDKANGRSHKKRPICRGDEVWIYNSACLSQTIPTIKKMLDIFHKEKIALHIYTLGYYDDCNIENPVRNDYRMLSTLLEELDARVYKRSNQKLMSENDPLPHKLGRKPVIIELSNLNKTGFNIIERFCTDHTYSPDDAHEDLKAQASKFTPPVNGLSRKKFYYLVNSYDSMLKAQNKGFFRSRSLKEKNPSDF